jgi:hypothetical protein
MSVQIRRLVGTSPGTSGAVDITSINTRLNAEDAHTTAGTTNPILKPPSGTNYSYWAVFRLFYNGSGTGTINNIKWFTDGSNGLGTGRGLVVNTATGYVQATGTTGETGTQLTTGNYATLAGAPSNAFAYTTGSPLSVAGSVTNPSTEYFGDFVVAQVTIADTASAGASSPETISWRYDSTIA